MIETIFQPTILGLFFAMMAAFSYALWNIYLQRGLEQGGTAPVALITLCIATVALFVPPLAVITLKGDLPPLSSGGVIWFALAGLMTTAVGPFHATQATSRIGAAQTTALRLLDPFFAFAVAMLFGGENPSGRAVAGVVLIVLALGLLQLDGRRSGVDTPQTGRITGLLFAVAASFFFTLGSVSRKLGLSVIPSAIASGMGEALAGILVVSLILLIRGGLAPFREAFHRSQKDLWISGAASAVGTLFINLALQRLPTAVAVTIRNTSPWFALLLAPLIIGRRARPGRAVWISTALLTVGMVMIVMR